MASKPVQVSIDPAALAAFDRALRRYAALTRKACAEVARRKLRDVLIKARAAMPLTQPAEIPDFTDGSVGSCKLVAWRLSQRAGRTRAKTKAGQWVRFFQRTRVNAKGVRVRAGRRDTDWVERSNRTYSRAFARAFAAKMTRTRWSHAKFSRHLFTAALRALRLTGKSHGPATASVAYRHRYKAALTSALKPRAESAGAWQRVIDRAISAGLRASAADMEAYLRRKLGTLAGRSGLR